MAMAMNSNSMVIDLIKTKELIFHNPRVRLYSVPPAILTIERVTSAKLLGIYIYKVTLAVIYILSIL